MQEPTFFLFCFKLEQSPVRPRTMSGGEGPSAGSKRPREAEDGLPADYVCINFATSGLCGVDPAFSVCTCAVRYYACTHE